MERKLILVSESVYTLTCGEIEVDKLINLIEKRKKNIIDKYPEASDNPINMIFRYDDEYDEIDIIIRHFRYETDSEYRCRMRAKEHEYNRKIRELQDKINDNKEEAINYLKSIGAI